MFLSPRFEFFAGGTDDNSRELDAVECFDPSTWTWEARIRVLGL